MPRLILFDLMQTVLAAGETTRPYWYSMADALESEGVVDAGLFNNCYSRWRSTRECPNAEIEVTLHQRLAVVVPGLRADVLERVVSAYMRDYAVGTMPLPGVQPMLEAWYGHVPIAVVSNFFVAGMPQALLERHGLAQYFEFILDSASVGYRKPSVEIFRAALATAGVSGPDTQDVIMIGDDWYADILGARRAGLNAKLYAPEGAAHPDVDIIRHWDQFRPRA